jgi:hypothetical protein
MASTDQHFCEVNRKVGIRPGYRVVEVVRHGAVEPRHFVSVKLEAGAQKFRQRLQEMQYGCEFCALIELSFRSRIGDAGSFRAHVVDAFPRSAYDGSDLAGESA